MGTGSSIPIDPKIEQYISITLERPNLIALMDGEGQNSVAYEILKKHWVYKPDKSIQNSIDEEVENSRKEVVIETIKRTMYMYCFTITGKPFVNPLITFGSSTALSEQTAGVLQSFCRVLGRMDEMTIKLVTTAYLGKSWARTTFVFQRLVHNITTKNDRPPDPSTRFACLHIRSPYCMMAPIVPGIQGMNFVWINNEFAGLIESQEVKDSYVAWNFKNTPFSAGSLKYEAMLLSKRLFLGFIRKFAERGYEFCAPMSLKGGTRNDTLLFRIARRTLPTTYFLISPEEKNRLRLHECPPDAIETIKSSITHSSIKECKRSYMGCAEIIFNGSPFYSEGGTLTNTQIDILQVISNLWGIGYKIVGNMQTTLNMTEKAVMLFENTTEPVPNMFGLGFIKNDTIKMLNVNSNVKTIIKEVVLYLWDKGIQEENEILRGYTMKLYGRPFSSRDVALDSQHGLHMLMFMVEKLSKSGWKLKTAIDVGGRISADGEYMYIEDGCLLLFVQEDVQDEEGVHGAS